MTYTTLFIDLDETVLDYTAASRHCLQTAFRENGAAWDESHVATYKVVNDRMWARYGAGEITVDQLRIGRFEALVDTLGIDANPASFADAYMAALHHAGHLCEGAREALETLAGAGYTLVALTNGLKEVQYGRLGAAGVHDVFDAVVISDEVGIKKPDPAIFGIALERAGERDRAKVLMVGDSLSSDIAGAAAAGIDACWVNRRGDVPDDFLPIKFEVAAFRELPARLGV